MNRSGSRRMRAVRVFGVVALFAGIAFMSCGDDDPPVVNDLEDSLVISRLAEQVLADGNDPSVSADGAWLAYEAGGAIIEKCDTSGENSTFLADSAFDPCWSHVSDLIVYRSGDTLIVISPEGSRTWSTTLDFDDHPCWSPNGDRIAVEGDDGAVVVQYPSKSSNTVSCSYDGGGCDGEHPAWSSDGIWIAFENGLEIVKVRAAGGTAETVVSTGDDVGGPAWSPDGRCIAFPREGSSGEYHIWVIDLVTGKLWQLTEGQFDDGNPTWSPDSRTVYFDRDNISNPMDPVALGIWRVSIGFVKSE